MKLRQDECHWTLLAISKHQFRKCLGAVRQQAITWANVDRQQAITWANVDPDLCRHMASLGHNRLSRLKSLHQLFQKQIDPNATTWYTVIIFRLPYDIHWLKMALKYVLIITEIILGTQFKHEIHNRNYWFDPILSNRLMMKLLICIPPFHTVSIIASVNLVTQWHLLITPIMHP